MMGRSLAQKSTTEVIRARFDADVERFANLETGQSSTMDAALVLELISQAALALVPQPRRMLDLGCGAGNNTLMILRNCPGLACDLLDLSQPMLQRAQQRVAELNPGEVTLHWGDFRELPLEEAAYDLVVAAAVLHHLRDAEDWRLAFDKLYAITAPGGAVLISDLVSHAHPAIQQLMWQRYASHLEALGGPAYREKVFDYIDYEDSPRPLEEQLQELQRAGFAQVGVLHKNAVFAAFYAIKATQAV